MRGNWTVADARRHQRNELALMRYIRDLVDRHDATDAELHGLFQQAIDIVRQWPIPRWKGWETDPRAQELIAQREARYGGNAGVGDRESSRNEGS